MLWPHYVVGVQDIRVVCSNEDSLTHQWSVVVSLLVYYRLSLCGTSTEVIPKKKKDK